MGTTLTGTTPANTYDSLIKVTDNGPLSGTAKFLSDGLGNDSVLALSTTAVGIGTNTPNVEAGYGTLTLNGTTGAILDIKAAGVDVLRMYGTATQSMVRTTTATPLLLGTNDLECMRITSAGDVQFGDGNNFNPVIQYTGSGRVAASPAYSFRGDLDTGMFNPNLSNTIAFATAASERMRIDSLGNVGIGTSAPTVPLDVVGATSLEQFRVGNTTGGTDFGITVIENDAVVFNSAEGATPRDLVIQLGGTERARFTASGLTFNGDTTANNALSDYETGTWTMGVSFGGASVGVVATSSLGTYTKIGRQVTVNGYLGLTSKGSSTGSAAMTGLPFTIADSASTYTAGSFRISNISFASQYQGFGDPNTTIVRLEEVNDSTGVVTPLTDTDFANNGNIMISLTYFV
jgi:hypothetical protein